MDLFIYSGFVHLGLLISFLSFDIAGLWSVWFILCKWDSSSYSQSRSVYNFQLVLCFFEFTLLVVIFYTSRNEKISILVVWNLAFDLTVFWYLP